MSDMLNAFVAQTYVPHGGIEAYEEKCKEIIFLRNKQQNDWVKEAGQQLNRSQNISDYMSILSNIKIGELDNKTESHPNLSSYDHSLEMDRLATLREEYGYVEVTPEIVDLSEMQIEQTPICENHKSYDVPKLDGIFDNVFGL